MQRIESIKSYKLKNEKVTKKFEGLVNQEREVKITNIKNMTFESIWCQFKKIIRETAKEVCGTFKTCSRPK